MNKILNEMPAWNDADKSLGKVDSTEQSATGNQELNDVARSIEKQLAKGKKPVSVKPLGNGVTLEIYEPGETILPVLMYNGKPIGFMRCIKTHNNIPIVVMMLVSEGFQGKGYGTELYKAVINHYGSLVSDKSLTGEDGIGGSYKVWEKLGALYPNNSYVVGMNNWADDFTSVKKVPGFTRDLMGNRENRFMVSTRPNVEKLAGRNTKKITELWNKK